ncbi:MAG: ABC transporter permease [Firmicutes bacterium]|nr:ABC transporter permease [Bacillota bacterium]
MSDTSVQSVSAQYRKQSKAGEIWHRFRKNKGAMVGMVILAVLILIALTVDLWLPMEKVSGINVLEKFTKPCAEHPFGTDEMGRDLFWRCIYATKYSLAIGFVSVMVSMVVGVPLGAVAGYYGGKVETFIMRITDVFSAIPSILMAIAIVSVLGRTMGNLMLAVGISAVPQFTRITRASVLTVKNMEYVEAARALGKNDAYIIFKHILPNCLSPIIVQTTLRVASAIISASSLSFLGIGIKPPLPEWGALLTAGKAYLSGYSYLCLFPGLAIMITVLAFNLVGDALRDAMDPKLKN